MDQIQLEQAINNKKATDIIHTQLENLAEGATTIQDAYEIILETIALDILDIYNTKK